MPAATPLSFAFWRHYFVLMRPYLLFISGITGLLGMAQTEVAFSLQSLILLLIFFFSYGVGQALTDCSQVDTDSLSSPYRPLVTGQLEKRTVFAVSITLLLAAALYLMINNPRNLPVAGLAIFGLATYTFFKRRFWGGPLYNGWIVAALCVLGMQSVGVVDWHNPVTLLTLGAVLFGYAHFVLAGYFKDIEADRQTGYHTLPVVYGRRVACHVDTALTFIAFAAAFGVLWLQEGITLAAMLSFILAAITAVIGQVLLYKNKTDSTAYLPILYSVHAYLLLCSALILQYKPDWLLFMMAYYGCFNLTVHYRPCRAQV